MNTKSILQRFFDLLPKWPDAVHPKTFFGGHFVALHSFWRVELNGETLTVTAMSTTWLDTMIKQKKTDIRFEKPESGLLFLTATTLELQEFVTRYADDAGAFPSRGEERGLALTRKK